MRRGTTPTHTFTLPFQVDIIKSVQVTYSQNDKVILKKKTEDCTLEGNTVSIKLTQEDTLAFINNKNVDIQVRVLTNDDNAMASDVMTVFARRCLDDEVME